MTIFEDDYDEDLGDDPGVIAEYLMGVGRPPVPDGWEGATCRGCGCWEYGACYDVDAGACWWIEADLCSHCGPTLEAA